MKTQKQIEHAKLKCDRIFKAIHSLKVEDWKDGWAFFFGYMHEYIERISNEDITNFEKHIENYRTKGNWGE